MNVLKKATRYIMAFTLLMILASCEESYPPGVENNINYGVNEKNLESESEEKRIEVIGDYEYPENPAEQLRLALENDISKRELSMTIGGVEKVNFDGKECSQFKINFTGGNDNLCVISFINKYIDYGYVESLDGRDNPSFTMAFKDPYNSQDMITVLSSVIKYLAPELSYEEAEHLAIIQDETISTDGYSMPQDINGYQIQARYTNPHTFVHTPDFEAKYGVNVRAIKQIWRGAVDTSQCQELITPIDYELLNLRYWEAEKHPAIVYANFTVMNIWQKQSYLHGETWVIADVESMTGQQYSLGLDTWEYPNSYELGVGQQYTLFIRLNFNAGIIYAVQQSELAQFNSRGEAQPIDYPVIDWENPITRMEPDSDGAFYDVSFVLESQSYGEPFAALGGHGLGEKQWPKNPARDGYTFVGWYDNLEWNGNPYTKDTPIYQDITLYAKWTYTGDGGIWPRAYRGGVQGIDEGSLLSIGQKPAITVNGYNMHLEAPEDQRFRWYPVTWRLSDGTNGSFSSEAPFQTVLTLISKGEQVLFITYLEEIFDGDGWQQTGQLQEIPELRLRID